MNRTVNRVVAVPATLLLTLGLGGVAMAASDPANPPKPIELQRHCRALLSAYKVPMQFKIVESLPLNASGKVLKTELRSTAG